jgi:hypothetical protein
MVAARTVTATSQAATVPKRTGSPHTPAKNVP